MRRLLSCLVLFVIAVPLVLGGCDVANDAGDNSGDNSGNSNTPTYDGTELVTTITGISDKTTATFRIDASEWRIEWSYIPDADYPEFSALSFFVYPKGEDALYETFVLADYPDTGDETYVYSGSGEYYLVVIAANLQGWTLKIYQ